MQDSTEFEREAILNADEANDWEEQPQYQRTWADLHEHHKKAVLLMDIVFDSHLYKDVNSDLRAILEMAHNRMTLANNTAAFLDRQDQVLYDKVNELDPS